MSDNYFDPIKQTFTVFIAQTVERQRREIKRLRDSYTAIKAERDTAKDELEALQAELEIINEAFHAAYMKGRADGLDERKAILDKIAALSAEWRNKSYTLQQHPAVCAAELQAILESSDE